MIKRLRERLHVSPAVFAAYINASISTVQKWENGEKKPSGAAAVNSRPYGAISVAAQ